MKLLVLLLAGCVLPLFGQDAGQCPMHEEHMKASTEHHADVDKRGNTGMGFPQDQTTHHFLLYSDGGAIEVTVNDRRDSVDMQAVRSHLKDIVTMFSEGDFTIPMFVHDQTPPGVQVMKAKRAAISYNYEEIPDGGRVRIKTGDGEALKAIQEFLRFQINDHQTGDRTQITQQ
jgi:hypothetical protein